MTYEQILTETRGRVGIITLNRPDRLNAMTATMHRELRAQMRGWNVDDGVGAMVITGAGRGFCSGADMSGFEQAVSGNPSSVEARPFETEWDGPGEGLQAHTLRHQRSRRGRGDHANAAMRRSGRL